VLARESVVGNRPLLVASDIREVEGKDRTLNTVLSLATAIEPEWLSAIFPDEIRSETQLFFDESSRRVYAEAQVRFRDLPIATRRVEPPPADHAARLLSEEVVQGRLILKEWNHAVEQWILRLNLLSRWCPELELPPIQEEDRRHLIEQICLGAFSYREIKERAVDPVVKSWVSAAQRAWVDQHAPERLELSNRRKPKVIYVPDGSPHIALRIQELFGVSSTPRIAMNRVPILVHILAPNMRPVQITQDLAGFWKEQYPRVKQELQRKYPKHEWR
jgi:ATP-dependent helicase HrpB